MAQTKTPFEWCKQYGVEIVERTGWADKSYNTPVTLDEFIDRVSVCTARYSAYAQQNLFGGN